VTSFAVTVYALVAFLAPRSNQARLPGMSDGLAISSTVQTPHATSTTSSSPTATPQVTPILMVGGLVATPLATKARTHVARSDAPELAVAMRVDHTSAMTGDMLAYEVVVKNVGGRTYSGALTINVHTPTGTLRCGDSMIPVTICSSPGDYDGKSRSPNDAHTNPAGTTKLVSIKPNQSLTVLALHVQVAPTAAPGTVLKNHAHIDSVTSITTTAPDVTTKSFALWGYTRAPDVRIMQ
jgi:hypothetical protein